MVDSRIEKWRRWCSDRIAPELITIYSHRDTYQTVRRLVDENGALPDSYFWGYLQDTYATSQAVAVRRQAEVDARVCTVGRLLSELAETPAVLSRDFFAGMFPEEPPPLGRAVPHHQFGEHFAGDVGDHLDPAIARADLNALQTAASSIRDYVDKHLAHSDLHRAKDLPTFADLDTAIDNLGATFQKYNSLLTASHQHLVGAHQDDWLAVFRRPWIRGDPEG